VKIRELLGNLDPGQTSLMLLCLALGNVTTAPIWGAVIERKSLRSVTKVSSIAMALCITSISFSAYLQVFPLALAACICMGASAGCFNVANNMSGVAVEMRSGKTLLPKFHAFYGVGVVIATAFSFLASSFDLPLLAQFALVSLLAISVSLWRIRFLYARYKDEHGESIISNVEEGSAMLLKTTKPQKRDEINLRLLMVGGVVMGCTMAEGSGHDWIASGIVQGLNVPESTAIAGFWAFALALMAMRFAGSRLVDRFGRVAVLRVCFLVAISGFALYIFTDSLALVILGCALWGFGVSMGYPLGISAASDGPGNSAFRASVVASIGSTMNIACPPLIGALANSSGIRISLLIPMCGLLIALACSGKARPV
jgi:MFS family permease